MLGYGEFIMKQLVKIVSCLGIFFSVLLLSGCDLVSHELPMDNLPQDPNCAADGPGCKQFNPDKPAGNKTVKY